MYSKDIEKTEEMLGEEKVTCLRNIFSELNGQPPRVNRARYRADHTNEITCLDQLEHKDHLIQTSRDGKSYQLSPYVLPIIKSDHSKKIIQLMCQIYELFKEHYHEHLNELALSREEIIGKFDHAEAETLEALYYLSETCRIYSGKSNGFPYDGNSKIFINEKVVVAEGLLEILTDYYRWNYTNPKITELNPIDTPNSLKKPSWLKQNWRTASKWVMGIIATVIAAVASHYIITEIQVILANN